MAAACLRVLPLLTAALLFAQPAAADPAAERAYLERLAGEWTGRGTAAPNPDRGSERVFCRITGALEGGTLVQTGRCAATDRSAGVSGRIAYDPASRRYVGEWRWAVAAQPASLSGERRGDALVLTMSTPVANGQVATATMTIRPQGEGYALSVVEDATGRNAASIRFAPEG